MQFYAQEIKSKDGNTITYTYKVVSVCGVKIRDIVVPSKMLAEAIADNMTSAFFGGCEYQKGVLRVRLGLESGEEETEEG